PAGPDQELRPAVAWDRDHDGRAARAPPRRAAGAGGREARGDGADPVLPRLLPLRSAPARRLRLRPDAPVDADARAGQRTRGHVPLPWTKSPGALGAWSLRK